MLVVDDNATNRLIAREALTAWAMQAGEAPDGLTALTELKRAREAGEPYEFVLLDSRMPDLNGFEVAERIQSGSVPERHGHLDAHVGFRRVHAPVR